MDETQLEKLRNYLRGWRDLSKRMKDEAITQNDQAEQFFWEGKEDMAEETLVAINEILLGL